jgi:hypothetical protein
MFAQSPPQSSTADCRVGSLVITTNGFSGPGISYKLSAFSGLQVKVRMQDIFMFCIGSAALALFVVDRFYLGDGLKAVKWYEWIMAPVCVLLSVRSLHYLEEYGKLIGQLKAGGSVVLASTITKADGVKALNAFQYFRGDTGG